MYKPGDFVKTNTGLYYVVNTYGQQYDIIIADSYTQYFSGNEMFAINKVPLWYSPKHKVLEIDSNMYYNTIKKIFYSDTKELRKIASGK